MQRSSFVWRSRTCRAWPSTDHWLCATAAGCAWTVAAYSGLQHAMQQTTQSECASGVSPQLGWTSLLLDSTGIRFPREGEWKCKSMVLNVGINVRTLKVRAIGFTSYNVKDAVTVSQLLRQLPATEPPLTVTGVNAYDIQPAYAAAMERNAISIAMQRLPHACVRFKLWKSCSRYPRPSLMDTKMHRIKGLGQPMMSATFERQVNALHIRAAVLNRFTERGCAQTVVAAQPRLGSGEA